MRLGAVRVLAGGFAALLALTVLLVAVPAAAQDTGWTIESFDVDIHISPDEGSFVVVEEITVDFGNLERRGIFRTIPVRSHYDDENDRLIRIVRPTVEASEGTPSDIDVMQDHDTVTIRIGDPNIWISGRHVYRITYRVEGQLMSFDSHEELYWNVTGNYWSVPILSATARIGGAPVSGGVCFSGPLGSSRPCADARGEPGDDEARFSSGRLEPGDGLTVAVAFPSGSITVPPLILEPRWTFERAFFGSWVSIPLTLLVTIGTVGGIGVLWSREARDRVARGGVTVDSKISAGDDVVPRPLFNRPAVAVRFRPPDGLRPGQLGVIIDERVDPVDISATIVDLAVRGHLRINEETRRRVFASRSEWSFERVDPPPDDRLLQYEQRLLTGLFRDGDTVKLSELQGEFHTDYQRVRDLMYDDAVRRGWFPRSPQKTRSAWLAKGMFASTLAIALLVLLAMNTTFALAAVPLVLGGFALSIGHRWMPHRTPKGSALLEETLGFRDFIVTAEAGRAEFAEQENLFVEYLPFAVVFGATDKWAQAFAHLGQEQLERMAGFYSANGRVPNLARLSGGLADLSARAGSGLAIAPSSSGGSGFSGGSSGGGGGGGGGGSW